MDVDLLVSGATLVTGRGEIVPDGLLAVRAGRFLYVGPRAGFEDRFQAAVTLDASGQIAFPGLINTHTHLYQSLLKGLGDDVPLQAWLDGLIFPVVPHLTERACELSAMLGCLEAIRSGTCTVLDYAVAQPNPALYDASFAGARRVGVRLYLGRGISERGLPGQRPAEALSACLQDVRRLRTVYEGSIWVALSPLWLLGAESLRRTLADARAAGLRLTLHVNETPRDDDEALARFGMPNLACLEQIGVLGPDLLAVHCVHVTEEDIDRLARHDVAISYNPVSNMYLGNGLPPVHLLRRKGIRLSLGTDGAASNNSQDMLETLKAAALATKTAATDARAVTAPDCLEMATLGAARAMGLESCLGSLEVAKAADFFLFDPLASPKSVPMHDPISALVYASSLTNVRTTVVNGQIVLHDGQITTVDEARVLQEATAVAQELVVRAGVTRLATLR